MGDVDLGCQVSREDSIKELIPPDPVSIIPRCRHRIGTVHNRGVSPGRGPCDVGLHGDCQYLNPERQEVIYQLAEDFIC